MMFCNEGVSAKEVTSSSMITHQRNIVKWFRDMILHNERGTTVEIADNQELVVIPSKKSSKTFLVSIKFVQAGSRSSNRIA